MQNLVVVGSFSVSVLPGEAEVGPLSLGSFASIQIGNKVTISLHCGLACPYMCTSWRNGAKDLSVGTWALLRICFRMSSLIV